MAHKELRLARALASGGVSELGERRPLGLAYLDWAKDAAERAAGWHRAKPKSERPSDDGIAGYEIGFKDGYLKAVADLQLHGYLPTR